MHCGRISHTSMQLDGTLPVAPSALKADGQAVTYKGMLDFEIPRALDIEEIQKIVEQFRLAAQMAQRAGFDSIEVHGANGYIIDQFLRDGSNQRSDDYGGNVEKRMRLLNEILDADSRRVDYSALRAKFSGTYIANNGYDLEKAHSKIKSGDASLVAFGIPFLANPDLVLRYREGLPLNEANTATFYGGDEVGYTDYTFYNSEEETALKIGFVMSNMSKRDQIIEAADQLFYQKGFEHTSFAHIGEAVNISRGNFYYHFKTKDEILAAVINLRLANTQAMLAQWVNDGESTADRIRSFINLMILNRAKIKRFGCPVGTLTTELTKLNHTAQEDANKLFGLFRSWLKIQFQQLGHKKDADELAMHLLVRSQGIATLASAFNDEKIIKKEVDNLYLWLQQYTDKTA